MYFKLISIVALILLLIVGVPVLHAVDDEMEKEMGMEKGVELDAEGVTDDSANVLSGGYGLLKDVVLVLDNSGSMKKNDPNFLTKRAVTEFISGLDESTRIAIVIFDQDVSLAVPLTQISSASKDKVSKSLDKIDYKGLFTDSPAAVERAIYELKNSGRGQAQKLIIFMTDGIVDTGNTDVDLEKSKWLKDSLGPDAADADIRIFGIAFTESADFQLIQSLAQKTDGEYYRALKAEDLQNVFERITTIINTIPEPDVPIVQQQVDAPTQMAQPALPTSTQPVIIEVPVQPVQGMGTEERIRSIIIIVAALILIIIVLAILAVLIRRGRGSTSAIDQAEVEAFLNDINGFTSQASYKLGVKPAMMGRVAGKDTEHLEYIVIPETTIGRRHSLIEYKDYAYWIVDQGSINGTFVNDKLIDSEVRLKHGDKVRLHKYEFEFVMPEMVDAGMTVISNTVVAVQAPVDMAEEVTAMRGVAADEEVEIEIDMDNGGGFDFDLTGGVQSAQSQDPGMNLTEGTDFTDIDESEDETLMPGGESPAIVEPEAGSEDETLMPGGESPAIVEPEADSEDETIMPGDFGMANEDATIRKEVSDGEESMDNFFDLDESDVSESKND